MQSPPGWHPDPTHRFELRYFNGQRWTNDVAVNGQRFVDPGAMPTPPGPGVVPAPAGWGGVPAHPGWGGPMAPMPRPPGRGMAITSFVLSVGAVLLAWLPFVFVLAGLAAIAAFVLGVIVINRSRRDAAGGRGFAVAGTTLSIAALGLCVVGFLFTRVVLHELDEFTKPGPHEAVVDRCVTENGIATLEGHITNLDDTYHDYTISVEFRLDGNLIGSRSVPVRRVPPGESSEFEAVASGLVTGAGDGVSRRLQCTIRSVNGPTPFGT
ncbi:MAG: DUF2510 domain-containing protein [Actinomycetota bacterium]|nr:DUF2510 domain-containing protein [Actinomycetota bacterium]